MKLDVPPQIATVPPEEVIMSDKELIRIILDVNNAPSHHLDWLTDSCPSVEYALTYTRPPDWALASSDWRVLP